MGKIIEAVRTGQWRQLLRELGYDLVCIAVSLGLVALPIALRQFSGS